MHKLESRERDALWVDSTDHKEAARALEMLHVQLISAVIDPYSWKWVIVAAHHSLQAFLQASLEADGSVGSAPEEWSNFEVPGGWLRLEHPATQEPATHEDRVPGLYAEMKRATGFTASPEVDGHVRDLCLGRNAFIENVPPRWQLHVRELPRVLQSALGVIDHLGWNPGHIRWEKAHLKDLARVKHLASQKILESLERQYRTP